MAEEGLVQNINKSETFTNGRISAEELYKKAITGNKKYRKTMQTFREWLREKEINESEDKYEMVDMSDIKIGDTIIVNNMKRTVNKKDIGKDDLLGITIFGDSYKNGKVKIKRILYPDYKNGKLVGYVTQR